jgi:hypothetical protein
MVPRNQGQFGPGCGCAGVEARCVAASMLAFASVFSLVNLYRVHLLGNILPRSHTLQ